MKIIFLFFFCFAKDDIYFYFDDGGEHDYFKSCEKVSPSKWREVKGKLKSSDKKNGLLGNIFEEGELTSTTEYYYSSQTKCNVDLKKASDWFHKENKK